jgi:hypothetical protein
MSILMLVCMSCVNVSECCHCCQLMGGCYKERRARLNDLLAEWLSRKHGRDPCTMLAVLCCCLLAGPETGLHVHCRLGMLDPRCNSVFWGEC